MKNSPAKPDPTPPADLSEASKTWWRSVVDEFSVVDAPGLELLASACRCLDRAEQCRQAILRDGVTVRDRFEQVRPHPLLAAERDALAGFRAAVKQMGFDIEPARNVPGRPPGR